MHRFLCNWAAAFYCLNYLAYSTHKERCVRIHLACNEWKSVFAALGLTAGYPHHPNSVARGISLKHCNLFNKCSLLGNRTSVMKSEVLAIQTLRVNNENGILVKNWSQNNSEPFLRLYSPQLTLFPAGAISTSPKRAHSWYTSNGAANNCIYGNRALHSLHLTQKRQLAKHTYDLSRSLNGCLNQNALCWMKTFTC